MIRKLLVSQVRFLAFRGMDINLATDFPKYLVFIILVGAIVGIGRYWDHPDAYAWQYAGLGSVAYIFILSAFLYLVVLPLRPARWSYRLVVVFVGLTSLPAVLYAIPVERYLDLDVAQQVNAWFLGVVAIWRVALYVRLLRIDAGLSKFGVFIATLLPLSAIVVALAALNLEHVVFSLMSGIREGAESVNDVAYTVVFTLSIFAYIAFPVTFLCYIWEILRQRKEASGDA